MSKLLRHTLALGAVVLASMAGAQSAAAQEIEEIGDFYYAEVRDEMTDENQSLIMVMAEEDGYREPTLMWTCNDDGGYIVMYKWDKYFIGNNRDGADVMFRFDDGSPSPADSWSISDDHKAAFLPLDITDQFTQITAQSQRLILRVEDSDGERLTDVFPLNGFQQALERLNCR